MTMGIDRLDHLVQTVADIDRTADFYEEVLGMHREVFGAGRVALKYGIQKINLHLSGDGFEPGAGHLVPGSADLRFILSCSLEEAADHLADVEVTEGPVGRIGALGPITSLYFRDPDDNLIEVSSYTVDSA